MQLRRISYLVLICSLILSTFSLNSAAEEDTVNENPLKAKLSWSQKQLMAGGQGEVWIDVDVAPPYHAYLDKFRIEALKPTDLKIGALDVSPIHEFKDTFSGQMKKGVEGSARIKALVEIPLATKPGMVDAEIRLHYQACTEKHCLFPKKILLTTQLEVVGNSTTSAAPSLSGALGNAMKGGLTFDEALKHGTLFTFLFIFFAGVLTSLTPCIYPMIPITLAIIGARASQSRWQSFSLSAVYVLGIAITFSSLGVFAALSGSLFGSALSHPAVVTFIALMFVALGLSMYGVFEIQAPAVLRDKFGTQKQGGYFGALVAGLVSGVVAGPCVGPVLIGVLAHVGESQSVIYGFSLLFTYALGMGILFLVLGTSSSLFHRLPKAGGWMDGVKFVFGTTMIAMALYYVKPLASEQLFNGLLALTLILLSSHFGAFHSNEGLSASGRLKKGLMLATFVVGVAFLLRSVGFSSTSPASTVAATHAGPQWQTYSESGLVDAKSAGKPVIIDFFAEWCVACKELEALTFPHESVTKLQSEFVFLKVDATEDTPELEALKNQYKVRGLPTLIFIGRSGEVLRDLTLTGFEPGPEFAARMQKAQGL